MLDIHTSEITWQAGQVRSARTSIHVYSQGWVLGVRSDCGLQEEASTAKGVFGTSVPLVGCLNEEMTGHARDAAAR